MKDRIRTRIEALLAKEFCCTPEMLNGKGTVYTIDPAAKRPRIQIMAYRNCVAVCTSAALHADIQRLLQGKSRDEIFELPLVYGQTLHYVPAAEAAMQAMPPTGFPCELLWDSGVAALAGLTGFENALAFDETGATDTRAVCVARDGQQIIAVAGAAPSAVAEVWEVGVDVQEAYRNARLGTRLVQGLTKALLERGIVPFYSASTTNVGSQMVAARCGYQPCWVDTYATVLGGGSVYQELVDPMLRGCTRPSGEETMRPSFGR